MIGPAMSIKGRNAALHLIAIAFLLFTPENVQNRLCKIVLSMCFISASSEFHCSLIVEFPYFLQRILNITCAPPFRKPKQSISIR